MYDRNEVVQQVSRTFALSINVLPGTLGDAVALAYLMFRISDGIEDHSELPAQQKIELLDLWASILAGDEPVSRLTDAVANLDGSDPEVEIVQNADKVLDWLHELPDTFQRPIVQHVYDTTQGMSRWQAHGPYVADEAELDDYMHEVAGRVGYLVTDLYALHAPAIMERRDDLMPLSRHCGLALQTVNVIRGMHKDFVRGWVFTPRSYYEELGLTRETMLAPGNRTKALKVVDKLAAKADYHLQYGLRYVTAFPRTEHSIRLSLMWPFFFAVRTLAISRGNPLVLSSEAKMSRNEIMRIVAKTRLFGWSNRWLYRYYQQLTRQPTMMANDATASAYLATKEDVPDPL